MEIERRRKSRSIGFIVMVVALAGTCVAAACLLSVSAGAVADADPKAQKGLARVAWLSMVVLGLSLLLLSWVLLRWIIYLVRPKGHAPHTPYVNAWSLAGERFKLDRDDQDDDAEGEDAEEPGPD